MKTLAIIQLRQITGGEQFGFDAMQDPFVPMVGPITIGPVLPTDDVTPAILQKMVPLVKMTIVRFNA